MSMPQPSYRGTTPRTLLTQDRAEAAAALWDQLEAGGWVRRYWLCNGHEIAATGTGGEA